MIRHPALPLLLLAVAGCSSTSKNEGSGGGSSAPGALLDDGFEDNVASCAGWTPNGAVASPDTAFAHAGSASCKVCLSPGVAEARIDKSVDVSKAGTSKAGTYTLRGSIRADEPLGWVAQIRAWAADGGQETVTNSGHTEKSWLTMQTVLTTDEPPVQLDVYFILQNPDGGGAPCCYIDDAQLIFEP